MASTPIPRNGSLPSRSTSTQPAAQKTIPAQPHSPEAQTGESQRLLLPKRFMYLEPSQPETFVNPDTVFDTRSAARDSSNWGGLPQEEASTWGGARLHSVWRQRTRPLRSQRPDGLPRRSYRSPGEEQEKVNASSLRRTRPGTPHQPPRTILSCGAL